MTDEFAKEATLTLEFTGYWLSGTGTARGRHLDDVAHVDRNKLPAMPMTQVKGQLRETAMRLAAGNQGGWSENVVNVLFGSRSTPDDPVTTPGALAFRGEARLSEAVQTYLAANPGDRALLFRRIAGTKTDVRGAAEDRTLRAVEAVVPLRLHGTIEWIDAEAPTFDWIALLDAACAATLAFGKLKADGYGCAIAKVEPKGPKGEDAGI